MRLDFDCLTINADCAIFDLDGTLIDSVGVWRDIPVEYLPKEEHPLPDCFSSKGTALTFSEAGDYVIRECGVTDPKEAVIDEWYRMVKKEYSENIPMIPGAKDFLKRLKSEGVRLALATASDPKLYIPCLERHGCLSLFETIVTVNDVKRGKGFPDIYLLAAERLGMNPGRCIVFEDILAGCRGAKSADMYCVGVLERHSQEAWEDIKKICDATLENYLRLI